MPLNVRRFCLSIIFSLISFTAIINSQAQQAVIQPFTVPANPVPAKTAADVMRERISKAKAFIAVRNYNAAIYELEQIRRETGDPSVQSVTNILLMNTYLEQGNYKKAQDMLTEYHRHFKANNALLSPQYAAIAGQVVKGARNQIDRYRNLGLSVSDRNLPLEAVNDIEKMREMLELLITQTKETSNEKNCTDVAMPLLEEATAARSSLARDEYDAKRWRDEGADAREQVVSGRSVVINATDGSTVAQNTTTPQNNTTFQPVNTNTAATKTNTTQTNPPANVSKPPVTQPQTTPSTTNSKPAETLATANTKPEPVKTVPVKTEIEKPKETTVAGSEKAESETKVSEEPVPSGPIEVGSLLPYAFKQAPAAYPAAARSMRASGLVKVEVIVDEKGDVAEVKNAEGHILLQGAAKDAIKKWKFRPMVRNGHPVKASGFVNFNFSL